MTARPIRRNAQTPDRNGKIFYTSTTSLSHISKQAGDVVTIWFNGMIKETAPAQLGVVYRIQKVE